MEKKNANIILYEEFLAYRATYQLRNSVLNYEKPMHKSENQFQLLQQKALDHFNISAQLLKMAAGRMKKCSDKLQSIADQFKLT